MVDWYLIWRTTATSSECFLRCILCRNASTVISDVHISFFWCRTRGVRKVPRLTQLITRYVVIFQHSFLQLNCTWSGISPKLGFRCRRIIVDLAFAASHLSFADNVPLKITLSRRRYWPPSNTWFHGPTRVYTTRGISIVSAVFARIKTVTDRQTDRARYSVCNNRPHLHNSEIRPNNKLCNIVRTDDTNQLIHNINEISNIDLYQSTNLLNARRTCTDCRCCCTFNMRFKRCVVIVISGWISDKLHMSHQFLLTVSSVIDRNIEC